MKVKSQVSDGQKLYLILSFVEIQDISTYAIWGHCFSFQSFPTFASSHFYSYFTNSPDLISSEGQVRAAHPL